MAKKINDETLLEMLLIHNNVKETAAVLKISENAIYKRLQNPEFRQRYDSLLSIMLSTATAKMANSIDKAVTALVNILDDNEASGGLKLQAANSLLTHCTKYIDTASILYRLDLLEAAQKQNTSN